MSRTAKELGTYIVADPTVCHSQPTFHGTHITVDEVLRQLAAGKPRDEIAEATHGKLSAETIAEAVHLAAEALLEENPKNEGPEVRELGKYVIAHPLICHGRLTIRGSRIFAEQVLVSIGEGRSLEETALLWPGSSVTPQAVAEALDLARRALQKKAPVLATV